MRKSTIGITAGAVILAAIGIYFAMTQKIIAPDQSPTASSTPDQTALSYTDNAAGFFIAYPAQLTPTTTFQTYYHLSSGWRSGASSNQSTGTPLLAIPVFRITQSNAYPRYYDAEVRIGKSSNPYDVAHCMDNDQTGIGTATTTTVINGISFTVFQIADAGMMQYLKGTSYRTLHEGACWAIEQLAAGSSYRDDPPSPNDISDATLNAYYQSISGIIQTFRFTK